MEYSKIKLQKQQTFTFGSQKLRVTVSNRQTLFIATDVCRVLGIANSRDAIARLDDDERGVVIADTLGGVQTINAVTESGLYHLVFISRKQEARAFRKWVTAVVLPEIREHGTFSIRKKLMPAQNSKNARLAFIALRRYVAPQDYIDIARMSGVSVNHVRKVAAGMAVSFPVLEQLRKRAAGNKAEGRCFPMRHNHQRPDYVQFLFEFAEKEVNHD